MDDHLRSSAKKINAMQVRQRLGEILNEVFYRGDSFIIERDGKPLAALIPLPDLEALTKHSQPAKAEHDTSKGNKRQPFKRRT